MLLWDLHSQLIKNNIRASINTKENRIEIFGTEEFDQHITLTSERTFKIEVYLAKKTVADTITREDFKKCQRRKNELIDELNSLPLPILFNVFGETEQ